MAELVPHILERFNTVAGMDTISSSVALKESKFRDVQNCNYFPIGGLSWRNGYTKLNTSAASASPCNGIYMARYSGANNQAILVSGGKLFNMVNLGGTWVDITNGITINSASTAPVNFAILNDILFMSNGTDTSWQTTSGGTTQIVQGSPVFTSALFNIEYRGYMFWGQTVESGTTQYDRLRFSDINNGNSFTMLGTNNFIDIAIKAGGDIRGAVVYNTFLYIFKRHAIYQVAFYPTQVNSSGSVFPFTQIPNPVIYGVGTQSHRSIVKFTTPITNVRYPGQELVFFVDQFGVPRIFDGTASIQVGYPISKSRDTTITSLASMDNTQLPYVWAINYPARNQIFCFMSKANSQMDTCWVLDYSVNYAWSRFSFANAFASGAIFEQTNGQWVPYFGDYAGTVYQYDTGTNDNGTAISSYGIWGDAYIAPALRCKWPWIEIKGTTGSSMQTVGISVYPDGSDAINSSFSTSAALATIQTTWGTTGAGGTMTWGVSSWAKAGVITTQKTLGLDAKTLRVKLSNTVKDNTATIEGFTVNAIPEGASQL